MGSGAHPAILVRVCAFLRGYITDQEFVERLIRDYGFGREILQALHRFGLFMSCLVLLGRRLGWFRGHGSDRIRDVLLSV